MGIERLDAIVMRSYPLRDTSRIVHLFTRDHGHVKVVAKGARAPGNRFGSALEPFTRIQALIYYRPSRDLQLLSQADITTRRRVLGASILRYAYASAVLELLGQVLVSEDAQPALFELLDGTLVRFETLPEEELRVGFIGFVVRMLELIGYRPELERCVQCRTAIDGGCGFDATRGGVVCRRCAPSTPLALSGVAREVLRAAQDDAEPAGVAARVADEMARVLDAFLRAHIHRYRRLKSLDLVRSELRDA